MAHSGLCLARCSLLARLFLLDASRSGKHQSDSAGYRQRAQDGRHWNGMLVFSGSLQRADVQHLLVRGVRHSLVGEHQCS